MLYLELHDSVAHEYPSKYIALGPYTNAEASRNQTSFRSQLMSNRIWVEDDESITFIKNHCRDPALPLCKEELDEFIWVKLRSIPL